VVEKNRRLLPALGRIGIICGVAIAFILGLIGTVYLNLRSSEVKVPDILGKNYIAGEESLGGAKLNIRKRASRYAPDTKPDTILDQSPRGGEMVKAGQTVAVVISRPPKEGESAPPPPPVDTASNKPDANKSANEANDNAASKNRNNDKDQKQFRDARNKNANSNNSANAKSNANANANNRNANNRNRNSNNGSVNNGNRNAANRNANNSNANNRNANNRPTNSNVNRGINNLNTNMRAPVIPKLPLNPNGNTRTP